MPARLAALSLLAASLAAAQGWPDVAAPLTSLATAEKDVAVIVGLERYTYVPGVPGAAKNAEDWYAFFTRTLRLPPSRVRLLRDAEATVERLRKTAQEAAADANPGATVWFVFIGHGAPAKDGKDGLLIGADAQQDADSLAARGLAQGELSRLLAQGRQARTILVLDACFSGRTPTGEALAKGLQPLVALTGTALAPRTLALTAAASDQFAGPLPELDRPAFSYLVLGALRGWGDTDGDHAVTAAEAVRFASQTLRAVVRDRSQTPTLGGGPDETPLTRNATEPPPDVARLVVDARPGAGAFKPTLTVPPLTVTAPISKPQAFFILNPGDPPCDVVLPGLKEPARAQWKAVCTATEGERRAMRERAHAIAARNAILGAGLRPPTAAEEAAVTTADARQKKLGAERVAAQGKARPLLLAALPGAAPALALALLEADAAREAYVNALDAWQEKAGTGATDLPLEPRPDFTKALRAAEEAARLAPVSQPLGWSARFLQANLLNESQRTDDARTLWYVLAASPGPTGTEFVLVQLGEQDFDAGRYAQAVEHYRAALRYAGKDTTTRSMALYKLAWAEHRLGRCEALLTDALPAFDARTSDIREEVTQLAADCAHRLGGLGAPALAKAPPALLGAIGARLAPMWLDELNLEGAERAWRDVLARAPLSLEAPRAVVGLAAVAQRSHDDRAADELRGRLVREYGPASKWLAAQRAARGPDGAPTDEQLALAASPSEPRLPAIPITEAEHLAEARARLVATAKACLRDPELQGLPSGQLFELTVQVPLSGRARATANPSDVPLGQCLARRAPELFVGASDGATSRLTLNFSE